MKRITAFMCMIVMLSGTFMTIVHLEGIAAEMPEPYIISTFDTSESKDYSVNSIVDGQQLVLTNTEGTGKFSIVDDPGNGNKSVKMTISDVKPIGVPDPQMTPFLKMGDGIDGDNLLFETSVKIDADYVGATDNNSYFSFGPTKGKNNTWMPYKDSCLIRFTSDGVYIPNGTSALTKIGSYSRNKWYDIKLFMQKASGNYSVYVCGQGEEAMAGTGTIANLSNYFPLTEFRTRYDARDNNSLGSVYISYIKVSEAAGYSIASSIPGNGQTDVDVNTSSVKLNFDGIMDTSTLNAQNISVTATNFHGQNNIPVTVNSVTYNSCNLIFPTQLEYSTTYKIQLNSGVKDLFGLGAAGTTEVSFTTQPIPMPPPDIVIKLADIKFFKVDGGNKIDITPSGIESGTVQTQVTLSNVSEQSKNATLIFGLYKAVDTQNNGTYKLVSASEASANLNGNSKGTLTASLDVPYTELSKYRIVLHLFDDESHLNALCQPIAFDLKGFSVSETGNKGILSPPDSSLTIGTATLDNETGLVTVSGYTSAGIGRYVTMFAKAADGSLNSVMQTTSLVDGSFTFKYYLGDNTADGAYTVTVGAVGATNSEITVMNAAAGNVAPKILDLSILGNAVSQEISILYDYFQASGKREGATQIQWLISNEAYGQYTPIAGANQAAYTIKASDAGKFIRCEVIPVTIDGVAGEKAVSNPRRILSIPEVGNVRIVGKATPGEIVSGEYSYSHASGNKEGKSVYRWLRAESQSGVYSPVAGADNIAYVASETDVNTYLVFEVTPVTIDNDIDGNEVVVQGSPERSAPVIIVKEGSSSGNTSHGQSLYIKPSEKITFSDIDGHWAKEIIERMASQGIIKGLSETEFFPDREITRAEFVAMIVRVLGTQTVPYSFVFEDVSESSWYADYVQTAYNMELISADRLFRPDDNVTREEMCKIVVCAYQIGKEKATEAEPLGFEDYSEIDEWARQYVEFAVAFGLVKGTDSNRFEPKRLMTRAEAATVIQRLGKYEEIIIENTEESENGENPGNASLYENAVKVLRELEIMEDGHDEDDESETVTNTGALILKSEFVKMIMRAAGTDKHMIVSNDLPFKDVPSDHPDYTYIAAALQLGVIEKSDEFYPERYITYQQAAAMIIKLLGYEVYAENNGGYPNGYVLLAKQKDISIGLETSNSPLTVGEAAQIVFNSLEVEVLRLLGAGNSTMYSTWEGKTLAQLYHDISIGRGRVTANDITTVDGIGNPANKGEVIINGQHMKVGETNAESLIGQTVQYYAEIDKDTDVKTLKTLYPLDGINTKVSIDTENIISWNNMSLTYYAGKNLERTRTEVISRNAAIIYNGVYWGPANNATEEMFMPKTGEILLLDSNEGNEYNTIMITAYDTYIVRSVDYSNLVVYDKYGKPPIYLNDGSNEAVHRIIKYGLLLDIKTVKDNDVLLVADSRFAGAVSNNDNRLVTFYASSESITGTVEEVSEEITVVDGKEYKISPDFRNVSNTNELEAGNKGRFYIDSKDRIALFDNTSSNKLEKNYGFIVDVRAGQGLDGKAEFKIFNAEGNVIIVSVAKSVYINDVMFKGEKGDGILTELRKTALEPNHPAGYIVPENGVNQLIEYELNNLGELYKIGTVYPAGTSDKSKLIKDISLRASTKYNSYTGTFSGLFAVAETTIVFSIPLDVTDGEKYRIYSVKSFGNDSWHNNIEAYNLADYGLVDIMTMPSGSTSIDNDVNIMIVDRITKALASNDEISYKVSGVFEGRDVSYFIEDNDDLENDLTDVKQGDIIRFALNADSRINAIEKSMLLSKDPIEKLPTLSKDYTNQFYLSYGTIIAYDKSNSLVAVMDDSTPSRKFFFKLVSTKITVFDKKIGKVSPGSVDDIVEGLAETNNNLKVVVRSRYSDTKDIVIIRPDE